MTFNAAAEQSVRLDLSLLPGVLNVNTGGIEAQVLVDGETAGTRARQGEGAGRAARHHRARTALRGPPGYAGHCGSWKGTAARGAAPARIRVAGARYTSRRGAHQPWMASRWVSRHLRVELDSGLRDLVLEAPGRRSWRSQVAIAAGQTLDLGVVDLAVPSSARDRHRSAPPMPQET